MYLSKKIKFFEKFGLAKLCAALQQKERKGVKKQQNKVGLKQFLARRGIGSRKPVAILRSILESSKHEIFCYLGDLTTNSPFQDYSISFVKK